MHRGKEHNGNANMSHVGSQFTALVLFSGLADDLLRLEVDVDGKNYGVVAFQKRIT